MAAKTLPKAEVEASDFGRGYATCLFQFACHRGRLDEQLAFTVYMRRLREAMGNGSYWTEGQGVFMWLNGASDHFYGFARPDGLPDAEWDRAEALCHSALDGGHGAGLMGMREMSRDEAREMLLEAVVLLSFIESRDGKTIDVLADAIAWDIAHALYAEEGTWSCAEDLKGRWWPRNDDESLASWEAFETWSRNQSGQTPEVPAERLEQMTSVETEAPS